MLLSVNKGRDDSRDTLPMINEEENENVIEMMRLRITTMTEICIYICIYNIYI